MYEAYGEEFESIDAAKKYVESLPYWAEAISKDGLSQTIFDTEGIGVAQRSAHVTGLNDDRQVIMSEWYSL